MTKVEISNSKIVKPTFLALDFLFTLRCLACFNLLLHYFGAHFTIRHITNPVNRKLTIFVVYYSYTAVVQA